MGYFDWNHSSTLRPFIQILAERGKKAASSKVGDQ